MIQSADGNISHTSLQSNDSDNVGKSTADVQSSVSFHNDNSAHSDSTPSSYTEADGSQNEGKGKEHSSARQEGQPSQPDGFPSDGNGDYYQKSDGDNHPNGYQSDK